MDVKLVVPGAGGPETGIGRYVAELGRALAATGTTVHLAPFRYLPGAARRPVLRAFPIGVQGAPGVLHFTQIMGASVLLGPRMGPSVVTVHDLGALYCPEDRAVTGRLDRALLWPSLRGLRRADHLIAVSDFTRGCLLRAGFAPERVTTVHHGIDFDRFRPGPAETARLAADYGLDLPPDRPIVLYVGNERPRKNLGTLVAALARLKRDGIPFRWLKVGAAGFAPGRADLERRIAELGLTDDVAFVEGVADVDLARFYRAASVYVQPSVWEGFGFPVLEAMACGTPVVAATAASLPEICGNAALLVPPRSAEEMTAAITRLLTDRDEHERLRRAGERRAGGLTWTAAAAKTRDVYGHLG